MASKAVGSVVTVVVLAVVGFGGMKLVDFMKKKSVNDTFVTACDEAKKAGLPIVHVDLVALMNIKAENDATSDLQKIGRAFRDVPLQDPQTREVLSDAAVGQSLEGATELLGLFAQATSGEKQPALGDFTTDIFGPFPNIKGSVKRLTMAAAAEARQGKWDLVKRNMEWSAKFCDMGTEPPFRTLAFETAETKQYFYGTLMQIMLDTKGSAAATAFANDMLKIKIKEPRLPRIWGGDLVMRVTEFETSTGDRLQSEEPVDEEVWVYPPSDQWKRRAILTEIVKSYSQITEAASKSQDLLGQLDAAVAVVGTQSKSLDRKISGFLLNEELMSQVDAGFRTYTAAKNLAAIAAYVFDEKRTKGAYPKDLAGTPVADLKDPFTGQGMRYATTRDGFMVYSVGPNHKDDGGRGKQGWGEAIEKGNDDFSFRFQG